MTDIVFETTVPDVFDHQSIDVEDGGQAIIFQIESEAEPHLFVRLQSYDESGYSKDWRVKPAAHSHPSFRKLLGRKVRVTIEVL